jgi:8-oxo-dGTP diphosphatase
MRKAEVQEISTLILVVAVALIDESGAVVMQRRRLVAEHGGMWEFPGGKVEAGESPESALIREIEEELGISLQIENLNPVAFASGPRGPAANGNERLVILLYTCREWTGELRCLDGEEIGRFAPGQLATLDMPPLDYPLAAQLVASLENNSA